MQTVEIAFTFLSRKFGFGAVPIRGAAFALLAWPIPALIRGVRSRRSAPVSCSRDPTFSYPVAWQYWPAGVTLWCSRSTVLRVRVFSVPAAPGGGVTRHPLAGMLRSTARFACGNQLKRENKSSKNALPARSLDTAG